MSKPFTGMRVLDASQGIAGPYCTMLLASHGAEVIKLEPPGGDWSRGLGARRGDQTALSLAYNRGKRSLALDLKHPRAAAIVATLADTCDVVVESFRPGVAERLGLGHDALVARPERSARQVSLYYVSISAFGRDGPYARRPGTDTVLQAFSGLMDVTRDANGMPTRIGCMLVDIVTGLHAYGALVTAWHARRPGRLDLSLMQASAALLSPQLIDAAFGDGVPAAANPPAGVYVTRDGWLLLTLVRESHWSALCYALDRPQWRNDPRFASFEARRSSMRVLQQAVADCFARDSTAHWLSRLHAAGVMASRVNTLADWRADPHVVATNVASPTIMRGGDRVPWAHHPAGGDFGIGSGLDAADSDAGTWPSIGEHGPAILREVGFANGDVARLAADGVIFTGEAGSAP